jgi:hypothetical protein
MRDATSVLLPAACAGVGAEQPVTHVSLVHMRDNTANCTLPGASRLMRVRIGDPLEEEQ